MTLALVLGKVGMFAGVANALPPALSLGDTVALMLSGTFDTHKQFEAASEGLKVPPSAKADWLDRQHAVMTVVDAPAIGKRVLYVEWRSGGPKGPISRQRVWAIDGSEKVASMRYFTLKNPSAWQGQEQNKAFFKARTLDDLIGYPLTCDVRFGWVDKVQGRVSPNDCRIVAASGRAMRLDVTMWIGPDGFSYQEAGILDSGVKAFAVPPSQPYRFDRVRAR